MSGTNSAERILAILDLFTEKQLEWTSDELIAELGYSRPTLYRYVKLLREAGLLSSLPQGGLTLGPRVVEMDYLMRKSDPLLAPGQASLDFLVGRYPCSSMLVRWHGEKLLCVASECSAEKPISSYPRGRPMPLARGAISRSIMANLPRRRQHAMVASQLRELRQIGLGDTVEEVLESLRQVRAAGVAVAHGEVTPGVVGVSAPVFDGGNTPIATLSVTLTGYEVPLEHLPQIMEDVRDQGIELSRKLSAIKESNTEALSQRRHA